MRLFFLHIIHHKTISRVDLNVVQPLDSNLFFCVFSSKRYILKQLTQDDPLQYVVGGIPTPLKHMISSVGIWDYKISYF